MKVPTSTRQRNSVAGMDWVLQQRVQRQNSMSCLKLLSIIIAMLELLICQCSEVILISTLRMKVLEHLEEIS